MPGRVERAPVAVNRNGANRGANQTMDLECEYLEYPERFHLK
jgi:hypothetical protein